MNTPFMSRHKVVLLRNAARRGAGVFLRQAWLISLDVLVRKKHLVFYAEAADVLAAKLQQTEQVIFKEILSWDAFCELLAHQHPSVPVSVDIGREDWFDKGWRLWIGEIDGRLACLGWLRGADQSRDFFCTMNEDSELLWHVTTLPDHLGLNLHVLLWAMIMRSRSSSGIKCFYTNCRDYNVPSVRNIKRMGFHLIGYATDSKITGRRRYRTLPSGAVM